MDAKFVAKLDWFLTTVFSNSSNLIFVIRIVNSFWIDDSMLWYDMIWLIWVIVGHHLKPNCNYSYGKKIVIADDWKSLCSQTDKFPSLLKSSDNVYDVLFFCYHLYIRGDALLLKWIMHCCLDNRFFVSFQACIHCIVIYILDNINKSCGKS